MSKEKLKEAIKASREEKNGIDAIFSSTTTDAPKKKIKTLTIDEEYHAKIRQIAAGDGVKISEIVYDAFNRYFKHRGFSEIIK